MPTPAPAPAPAVEVPDDLDTREFIDTVMTNFDHRIEPWAEERLKSTHCAGDFCAWEFHAMVWYDLKTQQFCARVKRYQVMVGVYSAPSLADLMEVVNADWGSN